ncbi:HET-domain-containing protein [Periconia macrospinosa]|uniref:HET-domain-containing protein n=1 Tax=Periconia macrospinosa TaxID=97972 RepID=A0A2V1DNG5_9PLEO|nr:HET-domain-containing protein [Periconia macrospinosa]
MESSEPSFQYQPLSYHDIRILHLSPGQPGDELVGDLVIRNLDDKDLEYDALSYMWGDLTPTASIHFGHQSLPIARNLMEALQRLRYPDKTLRIWIDAICINQNDIDERSAQVSLMRQVYRSAKTVRSWVNVSLDTSSQAIKALQSFRFTNDSDQRFGLGNDPTFWDAVAPLFNDTYWSRAWIQQEVVNARELVIHCVNADFDGANVMLFQIANEDAMQRSLTADPASMHLWREHFYNYLSPSRDLLNKRFGSHEQETLFGVLRAFCQVGMTRECDYLYALMHLASDYHEGAIEVDYSKSRLEVVIDATEYHLRHHGDLEFLALTSAPDTLTPQGTFLRTFPTWISPRLVSPELNDRSLFSSGDCAWGRHQSSASICKATRRLKLRGIRIDHIYEFLTSGPYCSNVTVGDLVNLRSVLYCDNFIELLDKGWRTFTQTLPAQSVADVLYYLENIVEGTPDIPILKDGYVNPKLCSRIEPPHVQVISPLLFLLAYGEVIQTGSRKLGIVPKCDLGVGDEVWMVLGCHLPIILRPQSDGTYWYSCATLMPEWESFEVLKDFTISSQPGDKIGDWTVQDIEIS